MSVNDNVYCFWSTVSQAAAYAVEPLLDEFRRRQCHLTRRANSGSGFEVEALSLSLSLSLCVLFALFAVLAFKSLGQASAEPPTGTESVVVPKPRRDEANHGNTENTRADLVPLTRKRHSPNGPLTPS